MTASSRSGGSHGRQKPEKHGRPSGARAHRRQAARANPHRRPSSACERKRGQNSAAPSTTAYRRPRHPSGSPPQPVPSSFRSSASYASQGALGMPLHAKIMRLRNFATFKPKSSKQECSNHCRPKDLFKSKKRANQTGAAEMCPNEEERNIIAVQQQD